MERYSIREAQDHLSELIAEARRGKTIFIDDDEQGAVRLVPVDRPLRKPRQPGSARGLVWMADDFDDPLSPS